MVTRATGNALAECALNNQDALGISYVIWRQRINFGSGYYPGSNYSSSLYYGRSNYLSPYSGIRSYNVIQVPAATQIYSPPPVYRSSPQYSIGQPNSIGRPPGSTPPAPYAAPVVMDPPLPGTNVVSQQLVGSSYQGELRPGMVLPDGAVVISVEPVQ